MQGGPRIFNREPNNIETRYQILWYQIILSGYQIVLKLGTYFAGYQFLTLAEVGSWNGGHDEGRLAEGVTTTLCTTQQVMPPGDGKICCGMTTRRPALRPYIMAATSVLMGSNVGSYALMCTELLMLRFSVSDYVFPSMASFCHSP